MEGLSPLTRWPRQLMWELGRLSRAFLRRFGGAGVVVVLGLGLTVVASMVARQDDAAAALTQQAALAQRESATQRAAATPQADGRDMLAAFERQLPAYEHVPRALQDLLDLAAKDGLEVSKGDYRPQPDAQGRFMRYRMALPVKGKSTAVQHFMVTVLASQRTLALESVQFKRQGIDSSEVEARIQWTLMTQLPYDGVPAATKGALR